MTDDEAFALYGSLLAAELGCYRPDARAAAAAVDAALWAQYATLNPAGPHYMATFCGVAGHDPVARRPAGLLDADTWSAAVDGRRSPVELAGALFGAALAGGRRIHALAAGRAYAAPRAEPFEIVPGRLTCGVRAVVLEPIEEAPQ